LPVIPTDGQRPTHEMLVDVVEAAGGSMSALDLLRHFEGLRYQDVEIQRAIQSALNGNILMVGRKLHLYTTSAMINEKRLN
jgi:hypothetical protein